MSAAAENSPRNSRNSPRLIRKSPTPKFRRASSSPLRSPARSPRAATSSPSKKALSGPSTRAQRHQTLSRTNTPRSDACLSPTSAPGYARLKSPYSSRRSSGAKSPYFKRARSPRNSFSAEETDRSEIRKATPTKGWAPPLRIASTALELDEACADIRVNDMSLKQLRVMSVSDGAHWVRMKGALKRNTCLEELELLRTRVESKTLEDICPVLGELPSFKSFVLCEDYSIYKPGWKSVADMMGASKSLEFVSVWAPTHSVRACIEECARGVIESSSTLKAFEMHHHTVVDTEELQPLIEALESSAHIQRFYLPTEDGASAMPSSVLEIKHNDVTSNEEIVSEACVASLEASGTEDTVETTEGTHLPERQQEQIGGGSTENAPQKEGAEAELVSTAD